MLGVPQVLALQLQRIGPENENREYPLVEFLTSQEYLTHFLVPFEQGRQRTNAVFHFHSFVNSDFQLTKKPLVLTLLHH